MHKMAMGAMLTRYPTKLIPKCEPTMVLGGSPIRVAAPPIFEASIIGIT
jgi:hypothetical protein